MPVASNARNADAKQSDRVLIVDEKNLTVLWLEEKITRRELTPAQADLMLQQGGDHSKTWAPIVKDALGSSKLLYKLARDFGSWKGARVSFIKGKTGDLVVFKGWPAGRRLVTGTRYRLDNPKMIELQVGKPGLEAAAEDSRVFGIYLVVTVDVLDYFVRDKATFGQMLGHLTVDIPSVLIAGAIGTAAATFMTTTTVAGLAFVGGFVCGPILVAFGVGILVGLALNKLDDKLELSKQLGEFYDEYLGKLDRVRKELGAEAEKRFRELANSRLIHDLTQDVEAIAAKLARESDAIRGQLIRL